MFDIFFITQLMLELSIRTYEICQTPLCPRIRAAVRLEMPPSLGPPSL